MIDHVIMDIQVEYPADQSIRNRQALDIFSRKGGYDIRNLEIIGHFDPRTEPETIAIKEERALYWLKLGAQPTDTTARLLGKAGIMEKFKPVKEKA